MRAFCAVQLRDGLRKKSLSSRTEDYFRLKGFDEESGEPLYRDKHEKRRSIRQKKRKDFLKSKMHSKKSIQNEENTNENTEEKADASGIDDNE